MVCCVWTVGGPRAAWGSVAAPIALPTPQGSTQHWQGRQQAVRSPHWRALVVLLLRVCEGHPFSPATAAPACSDSSSSPTSSLDVPSTLINSSADSHHGTPYRALGFRTLSSHSGG